MSYQENKNTFSNLEISSQKTINNKKTAQSQNICAVSCINAKKF